MYRIVHNEQTETYRVEKKGLLGWNFVSDPLSRDYLQFAELSGARQWVQSQNRHSAQKPRRWKIVSDCNQ